MEVSDWSGTPLLIVWGVVAFFLGGAFATSPDLIESMYRARISRIKIGKRLGDRHAPSASVIRWYRVGGIFFMVAGIAAFVGGVVGTIGYATGLIK